MKIKRNIALSESGFVFNPVTGDSFSTNPVGLEIIRMLKEENSMEEIKNFILTNYLTDEGSFEKDYYDFVNLLVRNKLVESDE
jgi:hypothetical protein